MLKAVETNKESLQQLKAVNSELERDVERVRQRGELLNQVLFIYFFFSPPFSCFRGKTTF